MALSEETLQIIRLACKLDPDARSEEGIQAMVGIASSSPLLAGLAVFQQQYLFRQAQLEELQERDLIFRAGDREDKCYVVLSGRVELTWASTSAKAFKLAVDGDGTLEEAVVVVESGVAFGEFSQPSALRTTELEPWLTWRTQGGIREADARAVRHTELLVIRRSDYEQVAAAPDEDVLRERLHFLRSLPCIEEACRKRNVTNFELMGMAACLKEGCHGHQEVVARQGDSAEHVVFVRAGQLWVVRAIDCYGQTSGQTSQRWFPLRRGRAPAAAAPACIAGAAKGSFSSVEPRSPAALSERRLAICVGKRAAVLRPLPPAQPLLHPSMRLAHAMLALRQQPALAAHGPQGSCGVDRVMVEPGVFCCSSVPSRRWRGLRQTCSRAMAIFRFVCHLHAVALAHQKCGMHVDAIYEKVAGRKRADEFASLLKARQRVSLFEASQRVSGRGLLSPSASSSQRSPARRLAKIRKGVGQGGSRSASPTSLDDSEPSSGAVTSDDEAGAASSSVASSSSSQNPRVDTATFLSQRLLRVGSVGPPQIFGAQQVRRRHCGQEELGD